MISCHLAMWAFSLYCRESNSLHCCSCGRGDVLAMQVGATRASKQVVSVLTIIQTALLIHSTRYCWRQAGARVRVTTVHWDPVGTLSLGWSWD